MEIRSKEEIESAISAVFGELTQEINTFSDTDFEKKSSGGWSVLMHLEHLIISTKAVNRGLALPKFIFPFITGKLKRPPYSYNELVEKYTQKLSLGAKASGSYIPKNISISKKEHLILCFKNEQNRLLANLKNWSIADLEKHVMPHPIIGKISAKEMVFFTIYHVEHHTKSMISICKK